MNYRLLPIFFFLVLNYTSLFSEELSTIQDSSFVFATSQDGAQILMEQDLFLENLSPFDRSARLKTSAPVSLREFSDYIGKQTLDWSTHEKTRFRSILDKAIQKIQRFPIMFPTEIQLIKSTGNEEGNAAYCRGANAIVIPQGQMSRSDRDLEKLIIHELFHIFSRNNLDIQKELYSIIGFRKTAPLQFPDSYSHLKITNPDAVFSEYYFESIANGESRKFMPILLASSHYDEKKGGEFFHYLTLLFLAVEPASEVTLPVMENNKYLLFSPNEIPGYFELIGENTGYIIHPEEILADNFELLISNNKRVKTPSILEDMAEILNNSQ